MKDSKHVFKLKGSRDYITGADIFNYFVKEACAEREHISDIEITFIRRIDNTACKLHFDAEKVDIDGLSSPCRGRYQAGGGEYHFALTAEVERGPQVRVPYHEDDIVANARVKTSSAVLKSNGNYTFIENLVALTKYFHNCNYELTKGKWIFCKFELRSVPARFSLITIDLETIVGKRLSKCRFSADKQELGLIYFTVW